MREVSDLDRQVISRVIVKTVINDMSGRKKGNLKKAVMKVKKKTKKTKFNWTRLLKAAPWLTYGNSKKFLCTTYIFEYFMIGLSLAHSFWQLKMYRSRMNTHKTVTSIINNISHTLRGALLAMLCWHVWHLCVAWNIFALQKTTKI